MRKKGTFILLSFVLATVMVLGQFAPAAAKDTIKLTYSTFFPPTHKHSKLAEEWCREVEKRTEGRISIDFFPGQTLTKSKVCYDGVVNGISDIGYSLLGYTRGRFPLMEVADLPLGQNSGRVATAVANEVYQTLKPKELSDTKVMYLAAHGPGFLNTRKKPVRTLADLKGLKIRAHGNNGAIVKALGGVPVAQPMPELYQLLQKGVVDGSLYPMETNKGWKMGEVIDYVTLSYPAAYTSTFFVVINQDRWNELSETDQKIIEEINKEWSEKTGKAWDDIDKEGFEFIETEGVKVIELSPAESERWAEAIKPIIAKWEEDTNKKGLPGTKALEVARAAVAKYKEMYK